MKRRKVVLKVSLLGMAMTMMLGISAFAGSVNHAPEKPTVNEIFINEEGKKEIVISVAEDGSFVTDPLDSMKAINPSDCRHTRTETYGSPEGESQSYNKQYSNKCYKTRTVMNARCVDCGKTGLRVYSSWSDKPHKYPLLSSTCKECGYKK